MAQGNALAPGGWRHELRREALRVISNEARSIARITIDEDAFADAVCLLLACKGRVVTTGIGKAGLVAQRIAATLSVTGTPAGYLHPVDAMHGDFGGVRVGEDVLLIVSRSGETNEIIPVLVHAQANDMPVIAITTQPTSVLAKGANVALLHDGGEACRFGLTPTNSVTEACVLGDALALVLQRERGFGPKQFAELHRHGALGRRLSVKVSDVMLPAEEIARVGPDATLLVAIQDVARRRGTLVVLHPTTLQLMGVVTAGDIARYIDRSPLPASIWTTSVTTIMTPSASAYTTRSDDLLSAAITRMQKAGIMAMPVVDVRHHVIGMVHLHDALKERVT